MCNDSMTHARHILQVVGFSVLRTALNMTVLLLVVLYTVPQPENTCNGYICRKIS